MKEFNKKEHFTFNWKDVQGNYMKTSASDTKNKLDARGDELLNFTNSILEILNSSDGAEHIKGKNRNDLKISIQEYLDVLDKSTIDLVNEYHINASDLNTLKKHISMLIEMNGNDNTEIVLSRYDSAFQKEFLTLTERLNNLSLKVKTNIENLDNSNANKYSKIEIDKKLNEVNFIETKPSFILSSFTPAKNESRIMQSICLFETDKKYLACTYCDKANESLGGDIIVYDYYTRKQVSIFENLPIYHANDICFNYETNEFVIVPLNATYGFNKLIKYDKTFTNKIEITYPKNVSGIGYNKKRGMYVIAVSGSVPTKYAINITDKDFNLINSFECDKIGVFQSLCSYDDFIFINNNSYIEIYNFDGELIRRYNIGLYDESEGIDTFDGENFLIGKITDGVSEYGYNKSLFSRVYSFNLKNNYKELMSIKDTHLGMPKEIIEVSNKVIINKGELNLATNITDNTEGAYHNIMNIDWNIAWNATNDGVIVNSRLHQFEKVNADTQMISSLITQPSANAVHKTSAYITHIYGKGLEIKFANSNGVLTKEVYEPIVVKGEFVDKFSTLSF